MTTSARQIIIFSIALNNNGAEGRCVKMVNLSAIPAEAYNIEKSWVERGDYVAPNRNVVVSEEGLKTFLYWIHERQSIWYKREVLGLEAP